jgi:hypothetical protein
MNSKDISHAKDPDLRASHEALRRASELARSAPRTDSSKTRANSMTDLDQKQLGKTLWNIADTGSAGNGGVRGGASVGGRRWGGEVGQWVSRSV